MSDFDDMHAKNKGEAKNQFNDKSDKEKAEADRLKAQERMRAKLSADKEINARDLRRFKPTPTLTPDNKGLKNAVHKQVKAGENQRIKSDEKKKSQERMKAQLSKAKSKEKGKERE